MFRNREALQARLETLLGSRNAYFQPPENIQLKYPAIIYSPSRIKNVRADNLPYLQFTAYDVIVVDRAPDSEIADKVSKLPMCEFNRSYKSNNLNHFSFTIYY